MTGQRRPSSGDGFTGSATDPARAVLACAALHRQGVRPPRSLLAAVRPAIAPAFGLAEGHTLDPTKLTDSAWQVLEGWARRHG